MSISPSLSPNLPTAAIDMAVTLLLPLLVAALGGDAPAARALALQCLADYRPDTVQELAIAAEAIGHGLKGLSLLAQSADPDADPRKSDIAVRRACSLSRAGHQAQRRLEALQLARRSATPAEQQPEPAPRPGTQAFDVEPVTAETQSITPTAPTSESSAPTDVAQAEATLRSAEKLLGLMKTHVKGALPPHSKAAQQIQDQQRAFETARLRLQLARKTEADAARQLRVSDLAA